MAACCVVLNTHFFSVVMGSTTDAVPTGASMGVPDSAANWMTPMALGEPDGPMMASTLSWVMSFLKSPTVWVASLPSSSAISTIGRPPIFFGNVGTVFFGDMTPSACGPGDDDKQPIL